MFCMGRRHMVHVFMCSFGIVSMQGGLPCVCVHLSVCLCVCVLCASGTHSFGAGVRRGSCWSCSTCLCMCVRWHSAVLVMHRADMSARSHGAQCVLSVCRACLMCVWHVFAGRHKADSTCGYARASQTLAAMQPARSGAGLACMWPVRALQRQAERRRGGGGGAARPCFRGLKCMPRASALQLQAYLVALRVKSRWVADV